MRLKITGGGLSSSISLLLFSFLFTDIYRAWCHTQLIWMTATLQPILKHTHTCARRYLNTCNRTKDIFLSYNRQLYLSFDISLFVLRTNLSVIVFFFRKYISKHFDCRAALRLIYLSCGAKSSTKNALVTLAKIRKWLLVENSFLLLFLSRMAFLFAWLGRIDGNRRARRQLRSNLGKSMFLRE